MEPAIRAYWDGIRIEPQRWQLPSWGDQGGGFWVVAEVGQECLYYNDIEEGFNVSRFRVTGVIEEYACDQRDLIHCVRSWYEASTSA